MASTIKPIIPPGLYRETIDTAGAPGGASGTLQYNNGGAFGGITGWTTNGTTGLTGGAGTTLAVGNAAIGSNVLAVGGASLFTGAMVNSTNGALSAPVLSLTGTAITGGTATTTKPLALIETTGATSNNWNTSGTYLGVNAANGFTGYLLDLQTNGTRAFAVDRVGQCLFSTQISGPSYYESSGNTFYANSSAGGVQSKSTGFFGFSSTGNAFDTQDTSITRAAVGVVKATALAGSTQALSGAGAANVTTLTTKLTSTGVAEAITLANGVDGQIKTIIHDVDGGSSVLTPATATGYTTITFTNVGETATLQFVTTRGWMILSLRGAVAA